MEGIAVHQEALSMSRGRVGKRAAASIMDHRVPGFNANGIVQRGIRLATNNAKGAFPRTKRPTAGARAAGGPAT